MKNRLLGYFALFAIAVSVGIGAQQTINIGTTANDGTGDTPRVAFGKANSNFTELYSGKANLAGGNTFTGTQVFPSGQALIAPSLGTPVSITLTNGTGLPLTTGITGAGSGVITFLATPTSANLLAALTTKTGTGSAVFGTSPTLVTPTLGVATATSINKLTLTAPATGSTLTIADGKTLTASNTITFTATDGSTLAIGAGGTLGTAAYTAASAYEVPLTFSTGLTRTTNTVTVNTSQNIATLSNLTSNGFVKTSGGTGALSIDTSTYLSSSGNGSNLTGLTQSQVSGLTTASVPNFSNVQVTHSTLTYAATTNIDASLDGFRTVTLTGNITFTTSNLVAGRSITVRIVGDTTSRTLTFPAWKFVGAAAPAAVAANKTAILTLTPFGTTDATVVAAYAVEP